MCASCAGPRCRRKLAPRPPARASLVPVTDTNTGPAAAPSQATTDGPAAATGRDKLLLVVFWAWAAVLLVATLAQLFGWDGILDALDAKRWSAR